MTAPPKPFFPENEFSSVNHDPMALAANEAPAPVSADPAPYVVPKLGVSAVYARKVLEETRKRTGLPEPTTIDVCNAFAKVVTADARTSVTDMLWAAKDSAIQAADARKEKYKVKGARVGIATVFVSHAWGRPFSDLVGAVEEYTNLHSNEASGIAFYWIDTLSVNQHGVDPNQAPMDPHDLARLFGGAIREMGKVCVVATPWEKPVPLTRCWCLWELFSAATGDDCSIELCMPPAERALHAKALGEACLIEYKTRCEARPTFFRA